MKTLLIAIISAAVISHGSIVAQPLLAEAEKHGDVEFTLLADGVWLHTSFMQVGDNPNVPVNGVIAVDQDQAVVIDLPVEEIDAAAIFEWISAKGWTTQYVVPQHWHSDSTGGLPEAYRRGFTVVMLELTAELVAEEHPDWPAPAITFGRRASLRYGDRVLDLTHHGGGHTVDSVVAWLREPQILVGGCLLKSLKFKTLGYIGDADPENYLSTLLELKGTYADAQIVTPGHGAPGHTDIIDHNITLCREQFGAK